MRLGARSPQDAPDCRDAEAGDLSDGLCAGTLPRRDEHPVLRAGRGGGCVGWTGGLCRLGGLAHQRCNVRSPVPAVTAEGADA